MFVLQFFSIIVFGCIAARGHRDDMGGQCLYGGDSNACGYGIGIGVLAFLLCIGFLVLEALFDQISGVQHRKYAVMADIAVSGMWADLSTKVVQLAKHDNDIINNTKNCCVEILPFCLD